jgi:uncharacterized protein HemX
MKKFHLHLDAIIVLVLVFGLSIGMNIFQLQQNREMTSESIRLTKQNLVDQLNLTSCREALPKMTNAAKQPETVAE